MGEVAEAESEDEEVPTKSRESREITTTASNRAAVPLGSAAPAGSTVRMVAPGVSPGSTVRMVTVGSPPVNVTDAIFNALDRNHDGVISPEEFGVLPTSQGGRPLLAPTA